MWVTGTTPQAWKSSTTILLFKKNDPFDLVNYRPIGLANALYKLWTGTVAYATMHHSLRHNIIHPAQEGGLLGRNTHRQIRMLINAFEDAHHFHQDLFLLYVDFSSAFNLVDHDKLLCIMYDLGLPEDIIDVVRDLYQGAGTAIHLPCGDTPTIPITRGTIQGDPLSPILFLLYIEPLLRWLHVGGRGYKFGCLANHPPEPATGIPLQKLHQHAGAGYVDDTYAITHTKADLEVQATKIEAFSFWAGTPVNPRKSAATAILHGEAHISHRSPTDPARLASLLDHQAAIKMGGNSVPYYSPTTPYPYLGVLCCPAMVWEAQLQSTINRIKERGQCLAKSLASVPNRLATIHRCIKPSATYALSLAPFTVSEIAQLDRCMAAVARQCCWLPKGFATSGILRAQDEAGLGVVSLSVDYAQISTFHLVNALRDNGRLGLVTKALLRTQIKTMGGAPVEYLSTEAARYCTALRQLAIINQHEHDITIDGELFSQTPPGGPTASIWKLTNLLRANLVPADILACLHELGVQHLGQLVTASGTHLVNTTDLALMYGPSVTTRHKIALNRLSAVVSGKLPTGLKAPTSIRSAQPVPLALRALPTNLVLDPQTSADYTARTLGMRALTQADFPAPNPGRPTIPIDVTEAPAARSAEQRRAATAAEFDRKTIQLPSHFMAPSAVIPGDQASLQAFWQQRLDHARSQPAFFRDSGLQASHCTWTQFRAAVLICDKLPLQLLSSLYDEQFIVTAILGSQTYIGPKGRGCTPQYKVSWAPTVMCACHVDACEKLYRGKVVNTTNLPLGEAPVAFL